MKSMISLGVLGVKQVRGSASSSASRGATRALVHAHGTIGGDAMLGQIGMIHLLSRGLWPIRCWLQDSALPQDDMLVEVVFSFSSSKRKVCNKTPQKQS